MEGFTKSVATSCSNDLLAFQDAEINTNKELSLSIKKVAAVAQQLDDLKIKSNRDEHGPSRSKKSTDDAKTSFTRSDSGYGSDREDTKEKNGHSSSGSPNTSNHPANFNLAHRLNTCPKTQHFSKTFTIFAHSSDNRNAGQIMARYINLPFLKSSLSKFKSINSKSNFYTSIQDLNSGNSDGLAFAKALFCPKGKLLIKHMSNTNQYCGPWGSELEAGAVLILQYLCTEKDFRRQGLAKLLLYSLIERVKERTGKTEKGKVKFVVVFPAIIKQDFEDELEGKTGVERNDIEKGYYDNAVKFYRTMGFRRIGLSKWFGLALDGEHKSHQVAVEDDLDPPELEGLSMLRLKKFRRE